MGVFPFLVNDCKSLPFLDSSIVFKLGIIQYIDNELMTKSKNLFRILRSMIVIDNLKGHNFCDARLSACTSLSLSKKKTVSVHLGFQNHPRSL